MSFIVERVKVDHLESICLSIFQSKLNPLLCAFGVGVTASVARYYRVSRDVQERLITGLPEVEGSDALDRLLKGIEVCGVHVTKGNKPGSDTRFVAVMVLALRCALGRLSDTPDNRAVAEREYRRICRARDVRLMLIESSRELTIDRFFNEECFDSCTRSIRRLPRWLTVFSRFLGNTEQHQW